VTPEQSTTAEADWQRAYRALYRARAFDRTALALQRQGVIEVFSEARGQEAALIGACVDLVEDDMVFPDPRGAGVAMARGVTIGELFDWFRGQSYCPWDWKKVGYFAHPIPVGVQCSMATGWAWASRLKGNDSVAVVYFGDGAASQGEVHEAMNYAGVFDAPVVFVLLNNGWAISTPSSRQSKAKKLSVRAAGYGFAGETVDGNDFEAVRTAARAAIEKARSGGGPTLIEAVTYRMGGHTTSDDPKLYRAAEEMAEWEERDPLKRQRETLLAAGRPEVEIATIETEVEAEIEASIDAYLELRGMA
jgi:2-oxoisovalerate dehydrogenase E1 component alpha subunit